MPAVYKVSGDKPSPLTIADDMATMLTVKKPRWEVIAHSWAGHETPEPTIMIVDEYGRTFEVIIRHAYAEERRRYDPITPRARGGKRTVRA